MVVDRIKSKKLRIVKIGKYYRIQKKRWYGWTYVMKNVASFTRSLQPIEYESEKEAEKGIKEYFNLPHNDKKNLKKVILIREYQIEN